MPQTLLSVDLDWLNGSNNPVTKLNWLLKHIPTDIPVIFTIEHHEFFPWLRKLVKTGQVKPPFSIINVDEHHDFYGHIFPTSDRMLGCGNWGYRLPKSWYTEYVWIHNDQDQSHDWEDAKKYLRRNQISFSKRRGLLFSKLKPNIGAAIFCVSPDYCRGLVQDKLPELIEMVGKHFCLEKTPSFGEDDEEYDTFCHDPSMWEIRPRLVGVKCHQIK